MSKPLKPQATGNKPKGRKPLLHEYLDKVVSVITNDGRNIIGTLKGYDQVCNVIVAQSSERVFDPKSPTQMIPLGVDVIRGDNIAVIGMIDGDSIDVKTPVAKNVSENKHQ